jgi:hypothetical protein
MRVDSQFFHVLSILKYSGIFWRPEFWVFWLCVSPSQMHSGTYAWFPIYTSFNLVYTSKAKHNRFCHTVRTHDGLILPINNFFLLTGISITRTGISNKITIQLGLGFCQNFRWEMGLGPPFRTLNTYK